MSVKMYRFFQKLLKSIGIKQQPDLFFEQEVDPLLKVRYEHVRTTDPCDCRCRWCVAYLAAENKELKNEVDMWRRNALTMYGPYKTPQGIVQLSEAGKVIVVHNEEFKKLKYQRIFGDQFKELDSERISK